MSANECYWGWLSAKFWKLFWFFTKKLQGHPDPDVHHSCTNTGQTKLSNPLHWFLQVVSHCSSRCCSSFLRCFIIAQSHFRVVENVPKNVSFLQNWVQMSAFRNLYDHWAYLEWVQCESRCKNHVSRVSAMECKNELWLKSTKSLKWVQIWVPL